MLMDEPTVIMSEEYEDEDQEMEAIHKRVGGWFDVFVNSPQYETLTENKKDRAPDIVRFFAEYGYTYVGMRPEKWNPRGVTECCAEVLPRKVSADLAFFQAVAPVLSAFFNFLAEKGLLRNARALAKTVADLDEEIVAESQDKRNWGMAKTFVMAAMKAGVDISDEKALQKFTALQNQRLAARQQAAPQAPYVPPPPPVPPVPVRHSEPKAGRNDPCPCGSGKKFKKCCGR